MRLASDKDINIMLSSTEGLKDIKYRQRRVTKRRCITKDAEKVYVEKSKKKETESQS